MWDQRKAPYLTVYEWLREGWEPEGILYLVTDMGRLYRVEHFQPGHGVAEALHLAICEDDEPLYAAWSEEAGDFLLVPDDETPMGWAEHVQPAIDRGELAAVAEVVHHPNATRPGPGTC